MRSRGGLSARLVAATLIAVPAVALGAFGGSAHAAPVAAFSASASADGASIEGTFPGAPLSDQLVDVSGPTASVAVNTIGASTGFAALPNPGDLVLSIPGLASGLLSLGVAGLPPIHIGSLPSYPFSISTNAQNKPDASEGAGPYALSSHSTPTSSVASASGGLSNLATGNAASLLSTASLKATGSGVVATATSTMEGLTIGPLDLGKVSSTATETRDPDGTLTPTSHLEISGASIGGIAVSLTPTGLSAAGRPVNLAVENVFTKLLRGAGVTVTVEPGHIYPHRVVSPALVITSPVKVKLGTGYGSLRLTTASATASLYGSAGGAGPLIPPASTPPTSVTPGGITTVAGGTGTPSVTGLGSSTSTLGSGGGISPPAIAGGSPAVTNTGYNVALSDRFDLRSFYLLLALVIAIVMACAPVHRLLGARSRWTSGD